MGCLDSALYSHDVQERYITTPLSDTIKYQVSQTKPVNPALFNFYRALSIDPRNSTINFEGFKNAKNDDERSSNIDYGTENRALLSLVNAHLDILQSSQRDYKKEIN